MPCGKKELAEQIIPDAARDRSRGGARQDRCRGGQEDRCDGADVLQMEEAVRWPLDRPRPSG